MCVTRAVRQVQLLPDAELSASFYSRAAAELMGIQRELLGEQPRARLAACEQWVHTVSHAAAVAPEFAWLDFEFAPTIKVHHPGGSVTQVLVTGFS